ncbi:hypothetical protein BDP27DRAFT_1190461, partial [Rhodocollybia butyracea]
VESFPSSHVITVHLPKYINPEMVTISVLRGRKLRIVADAWHMEKDCKCHYEWLISFFSNDIDLNAVKARFEASGLLVIDV